jgi:hypothetical protein
VRELVTTVGELAGALLISYGAWLAWAPLGFIVAGLLVIAVCFLIALDTTPGEGAR